jgi:hypothetical protein
MSDSKYYQTKEFYIAYSIMINAARHQGFATYQEIAQAVGLPTAGNYMSKEIGSLIGAVSENEIKLGRPMLSSIVIGTNDKPGEGYYVWAKQLGVLREGENQEEFWKAECKKIYTEWKISYRITKTKS